MNRSVRARTQRLDLSDQSETEGAECLKVNEYGVVDWIRLPSDIVLTIFTHLSYRDRANLSSTCTSWKNLGSSPCLWRSLDLRWSKMQPQGSRCSPIQKLQFRGSEDTCLLGNLEAESLKELRGENCPALTDSTLAVIVVRHTHLESIQLGPDFCKRITGDGIATIANCCPKLKKLRISGVPHVNAKALTALANNCQHLQDVAFVDCLDIDEVALGKVVSLRFLSVAGTTNLDWDLACKSWCNLRYLKGLDASRTDLAPGVIMKLIFTLKSLKVLCVFLCPSLEEDPTLHIMVGRLGVMMLDLFNNKFILSHLRNRSKKDKNLADFMTWAEWILSHALLRLAEVDPTWLYELEDLLLNLLQSSQEDVQEWAAIGFANVVVTRFRPLIGGGAKLLLRLATSLKEGIQYAATKALANLSKNPDFAKSVLRSGGAMIFVRLAKTTNRWVAEEAALWLWNLAYEDQAVAESGVIKSLVDLIFKWSRGGDVVTERAVGALTILAYDEKCGMEIVAVGGIKALVMLARVSKHKDVQTRVAAALAKLTDNSTNNAAVGQEDGVMDVLILLLRSEYKAACNHALFALWHLLTDHGNVERFALAGGIEVLVSLARTCITAHQDLQGYVARNLWALSVSEANRIAIGREGGIAALIRLAQSMIEDVQEHAVGALWYLAFNPGNALRIVEDGGVMVLYNLNSSNSNKARYAALAFAYMCDGRMDEYARVAQGGPNRYAIERAKMTALNYIEDFLLTFVDRQAFFATSLSLTSERLAQAADSAFIAQAWEPRSNRDLIGGFVSMLRNKCSVLKSCAAFAIFQLTFPGMPHTRYHVNILQELGAPRVLRVVAAAAAGPLEAKIFAKLVLRNMDDGRPMPRIFNIGQI